MAKARPKQFIREWRKFRDLTQEQLAERMGIARSYVSHVEKGVRRYDQLFLEAAADALNCRPWDLIERPPGADTLIRDVLAGIPEEDKPKLMKIIQAFKTGTEG